MSKFMDFYSHVTGSEEITKKLTDFMSKFDGSSDQDALLEALIVFAKEEGFDFEKAEVKAFLDGMTAGGELSDSELEAVAGGKGGCFIIGANDGLRDACILTGTNDDGGGFCFIIGVLS